MRAWFRCINGCPAEHSLDQVLYRCPTCDDLLEVAHDLDSIRAKSAAAWRETFDSRLRSVVHPFTSGVWGKKEWVCPSIPDEHIVTLGEGATALLPAERLAKHFGIGRLWVKQCGVSHTGSFKDLGMTVLVSMVNHLRKKGTAIRAIACASTGDTSAALAAFASVADIPALVLLPRGKISTAQLVQPLANGAHVLALDTDFDGCMKIVQRLANDAGVYLANSMNSLRLEGQKTVAIEIVQQLGWRVPDVIVIPGGNLGNVSALGAGLDLLEAAGVIDKRPRIVVAQAEAANPLYLASRADWQFAPISARTTLASAIQIGNPVSIAKAIRTLKRYDGIVEQTSEAELGDAAAAGDRLSGLFNCPHTGVALGAVAKLAKTGAIAKDAEVVVISTAHGLKFADFKVGYHNAETSAHANRPVELPADYAAVERTLDRLLPR